MTAAGKTVFCISIFALFSIRPLFGMEDRLKHLFRSDVRIVRHVSEIDADVLAAFQQYLPGDQRLAEPGTRLRYGDSVLPNDPPTRRLVFAAQSGGTWFLHYEHWDWGRQFHLVALGWGNRRWHLVYAGSARYEYKDLDALRRAIETNRFTHNIEL
jgi:hypothetical protein